MVERVCIICGEKFETKYSRRRICYREHTAQCKICGATYILDQNNYNKARCCSKECSRKSSVKGMLSAEPKIARICELCGDTFLSKSYSARICPKHTTVQLTCDYCGKEYIGTRQQYLAPNHCCSAECSKQLQLKHYYDTCGKDTNPEGFRKMRGKMEATMQDRYGVKYSMQNPESIAKSLAAKRERYGDNLEKISERQSATLMERYGAPYMMQVDDFKDKSKATCVARYGVDNYAKSTKFLMQVITDPSKVDALTAFKEDPERFVHSTYTELPTLSQLSKDLGVADSSVGYWLDTNNCKHLVTYSYSRMEDEVYSFLTSITDTTIERNTFKIITPYELDIYLPEYNIAIECDPTITHNSTVPGFGPHDEPKSKGYHKMKTDLCEAQNIFLYHIFGYDWTHKQEVVKSMLRSLLNATPTKIYARNTQIVELPNQIAVDFLNDNHRQGGAISSIRLGLKHNDELVAVMTFSKMRNTLGRTDKTADNCYELVRFCTKLNTPVVGGASKLFKHFIQTYKPEEVRSFSDRAHTRGNLYKALGFEYDHTSEPGYVWVSLKTDISYSRVNAQKQNIKKFIGDDSLDLSKTETQLMTEHGYVQVFDSGVILWIWKGEI